MNSYKQKIVNSSGSSYEVIGILQNSSGDCWHLLKTEGKSEWVVGLNWDAVHQSWSRGHYFSSPERAREFFLKQIDTFKEELEARW